MADLKIFINGEMADIANQDNFPIMIQRQVMDFAKNTQGGDRTYDILFPPTKTNDNIFGPHFADVGASKKFNSVKPLSVEVFSNGTRIFKGVPLLLSASKGEGYPCRLFSDNIDWVSRLQSKSLRDLATLPDVAFVGSRFYGAPHEPVSPLRQEDIWPMNATQCPVAFPLVAYGNYGSAVSASKGLLANKIDNIKWVDIQPAVYKVAIVRAIFREVGFNLAGGFFDTPDFQKAVLAYTGDTPPRWNWGLLARANCSNTSYAYNAILVPSNTNFDFHINRALLWRLVTGVENWDYSDSYFQSSPIEEYIVPVSGAYTITINTGNITLNKGLEGILSFPPPYDYTRTAIAVVIIPDDTDEYNELMDSITEYISIGSVTMVSNYNVVAFYDFGTGYQESPFT